MPKQLSLNVIIKDNINMDINIYLQTKQLIIIDYFT